jgi:hypothetical protein
MRFISKIVAKIISDRERAKNQPTKEDIKEGLRNNKPIRHGVEFKDDPPSNKPKYSVKDNKVIVPEAFRKSVDKSLLVEKTKRVSKLKSLLKDQDWIDQEALDGLINRFSDVENGKEFLTKIIKESHHEPYFGDIHNAAWRISEKEEGLPHPLPRKVEDLKGTLGKDVPMGGSDPFIWMDSKYKVTLKLLEKHKGKPLTINTRSDLIAHDDYIEAMDKKNHKIRIHLLADDKDGRRFQRVLEPGAPSDLRRIKAIEKLALKGFDVVVVIDKLEHDNMPKEIQDVLLKPLKVKQMLGSLVKVKVVENKVKLTEPAFAAILKATGLGPQQKVG